MFKYHEGVLTESEKKSVVEYISMDEALTEEFRLWSITRLSTHMSVQYPDLSDELFKKDHFYKTSLFKSLTYFFMGSVLTVGIVWLFWSREVKVSNQIVKEKVTQLDNAPMRKAAPVSKVNSEISLVPRKTRQNSTVIKVLPNTDRTKSDSTANKEEVWEQWSGVSLTFESISLDDTSDFINFDQRKIVYPIRKAKEKKRNLIRRKQRFNFRPEWKFKEEDADF